MAASTSGFLPRSSDLNLRERKDRFVGTENLDEFLKDEFEDAKDASKTTQKNIISCFYKAWSPHLVAILLTIASFAVRFYKIDRNNTVVWDEAHFGKFGSYYVKHEFYHDVHPPLGKMLIALSEYLAGFDGNFEFNSNSAYEENINYKFMRQFNASFGALCVPLTFYTMRNMYFDNLTVYLVTLMVCLEHSYIVLSKFILLDSMLLFFTILTFFCLTQLHQYRKRQLTIRWLSWLLATGASIGCVCSVKWVGLFITGIVGIYTILDLYSLHYDKKISRIKYIGSWLVRIISLIILPAILYMLFFKVHFSLLYKSGTGDSSTHTLFQANLEGTQIKPSPRNIAFGSEVTIRSHGLSPGLLHSHKQNYPGGSNQKQVTGYSHRDNNNDWIIKFSRESELLLDENGLYQNQSILVKNGDTMRIVHKSLQSNLHTHRIPSHVSKGNYEVSGYGNDMVGDLKDDWVLEIVEQARTGNDILENEELVHPLTTSFRLRNKELGCYLAATGLSYPGWGYNQAEIACKYPWNKRDKSTWWNIEDHINSNLETDDSFIPPKSKFWTDFVVINFAMASSNSALVPDPDKYDRLASEPWQWPTLYTGLRMCTWSDRKVKYYLIGSPFNTWISTCSLIVLPFLFVYELFKYQRQTSEFNEDYVWKLIIQAVLPFISWCFHYIPFTLMGRVTYVHHYVPALYFAILIFGYLVDRMISTRSGFVKYPIYCALYTGCILTYWVFSPLCQGMPSPSFSYRHLDLLSSWDITDVK